MPVRRGAVTLAFLALILGACGGASVRTDGARTSTATAAVDLARTPPCRARQLTGSGGWQGATQTMLGGFTLTDIGHAACSLSGYLGVSLTSQSGQSLSVTARHSSQSESGGMNERAVSKQPTVMLVPGGACQPF
jgi:hypothetical protein